MKMNRIWLIGMLSLFSSSCSLLSPVKLPEVSRFTLDKANLEAYRKVPLKKNILVTMTKAKPGYDTSQMMYLEKRYQLKAFSLNSWTAPPAQLIVPLLVESLRNTHVFHAVESAPYAGLMDYRLDTNLIYLHQNFVTQPNSVDMELSATLYDQRTQKVVASQRFSSSIPTEQADPYGGVLAANAASHSIMKRLSRFVVRHVT